jgi:hypothetical protein
METREVGIFKQIKRRGGILSVKVQSRIAFYFGLTPTGVRTHDIPTALEASTLTITQSMQF